MQIGMGVLGWPPSEFWAASLADFWAAAEGWREANNGGGTRSRLGVDDIESLREMLDAHG